MRFLGISLAVAAGLAFGPAAQAFQIHAVDSIGNLISFDSASPGTITASNPVSGLQSDEVILGIDFRPATGQLYALGSTSRLYSLNTATGGATQVGAPGAFGLSGVFFGFDINPIVDRIRVTSNADQNLSLDPTTAGSTTGTPLAYFPGDPNAGANPLVVGSAYSNNFSGAASTTLYALDSQLDILAIQNPPTGGTLHSVGSLGVNFDELVGFDIVSIDSNNEAFAALHFGTDAASWLYRINLGTGAATPVGTIGATPIVALAIEAPAPEASVPEPSALMLLGMALLGLWGIRLAGEKSSATTAIRAG